MQSSMYMLSEYYLQPLKPVLRFVPPLSLFCITVVFIFFRWQYCLDMAPQAWRTSSPPLLLLHLSLSPLLHLTAALSRSSLLAVTAATITTSVAAPDCSRVSSILSALLSSAALWRCSLSAAVVLLLLSTAVVLLLLSAAVYILLSLSLLAAAVYIHPAARRRRLLLSSSCCSPPPSCAPSSPPTATSVSCRSFAPYHLRIWRLLARSNGSLKTKFLNMCRETDILQISQLLVIPIQVNIGNTEQLVANKSITQLVEVISHSSEKSRRLDQILRSQDHGSKVIIFCSTKRMCDQLVRNLSREYGASAIHGDKSQAERDSVLSDF